MYDVRNEFMSRIQTVKPNYQPKIMPSNGHSTSKATSNPSFKGGLNPQQQNLIWDIFISKHKVLAKLSSTAGEVQNIIFIGLGTAFVAPIFIAYNPLSKQDDKTKKYSALRQPISAIIATATGLGINMPVTAAFNKMAAQGKLQKFNMEAKPPSDFLKDRYNGIIKHFTKIKEKDKKYFDLANDGTITDLKSFQKRYPNFQEFINGVHSATKAKAAQKLLDPNNFKTGLRNMSLKDFMVKNLKVKQHPNETDQLNPDFIKKYIKDTNAVGFLKEMGIDVDESTVRTFLGKNFYKEKFDAEMMENHNLAGEMFNIIKKNSKEGDFAGLDEKKLEKLFKESISKRGFNEDERKTISRLSELWVDEKTKNEEKISVKSLFKVLGLEDDFYKHECLNTKMDKFLLWIDKNLTDGIRSDFPKQSEAALKETVEHTKKLAKFAGQIAANRVTRAESDFKAYSKIQGIVLSLAILPFACGALNWSYPRIMEKCFPGLSDKKADNKAAKPAEKTTEKPVDKVIEKPVEKVADKPVENKGGK